MTAAPSLWTKHRPLAHKIATGYGIPGADRDDVHQEALIGLWIASRNWDEGKGRNFPSFARLVITARLNTILRQALQTKHAYLTDAARDDELELCGGPDLERLVVARDTLARITVALALLPEEQRQAIANIVNGRPLTGKREDNMRYRARKTLKEAA